MARKQKTTTKTDNITSEITAEIKFKKFEFTQRQKDFIEIALDNKTKVMFVSGPAGTSKTLLSVYCGLLLLQKHKQMDMLYVRTAVESSEAKLGFLPGELDAKIEPYMMPLRDKIEELIHIDSAKQLESLGRIQAMPINFLRGANFIDKFIIADESQNMTAKELQTLMTRIGKHSKLFICGDPLQSDINGKSGFRPVFDLFDCAESFGAGIRTFEFTKEDIMRSEIVKHIVEKFDEYYGK